MSHIKQILNVLIHVKIETYSLSERCIKMKNNNNTCVFFVMHDLQPTHPM